VAGSLQKTGGMADFYYLPVRVGPVSLSLFGNLLAGGRCLKVAPINKKPTGQMLSWRWVSGESPWTRALHSVRSRRHTRAVSTTSTPRTVRVESHRNLSNRTAWTRQAVFRLRLNSASIRAWKVLRVASPVPPGLAKTTEFSPNPAAPRSCRNRNFQPHSEASSDSQSKYGAGSSRAGSAQFELLSICSRCARRQAQFTNTVRIGTIPAGRRDAGLNLPPRNPSTPDAYWNSYVKLPRLRAMPPVRRAIWLACMSRRPCRFTVTKRAS
jgi:hypothetical protein